METYRIALIMLIVIINILSVVLYFIVEAYKRERTARNYFSKLIADLYRKTVMEGNDKSSARIKIVRAFKIIENATNECLIISKKLDSYRLGRFGRRKKIEGNNINH